MRGGERLPAGPVWACGRMALPHLAFLDTTLVPPVLSWFLKPQVRSRGQNLL